MDKEHLTALAFTKNFVVTSGLKAGVRFWNPKTRRQLRLSQNTTETLGSILTGEQFVTAIEHQSSLSDRTLLYLGDSSGQIHVLDLNESHDNVELSLRGILMKKQEKSRQQNSQIIDLQLSLEESGEASKDGNKIRKLAALVPNGLYIFNSSALLERIDEITQQPIKINQITNPNKAFIAWSKDGKCICIGENNNYHISIVE